MGDTLRICDVRKDEPLGMSATVVVNETTMDQSQSISQREEVEKKENLKNRQQVKLKLCRGASGAGGGIGYLKV